MKVWTDLMAEPVEDLDLSIRSFNCLKVANIDTLGDLVRKTEGEMLRTKNFGRKSLNEIKELLSELGLSFGMKLDAQGVPVEFDNRTPYHIPLEGEDEPTLVQIPPPPPLKLEPESRPWRGYRAHSRIDWGTNHPNPDTSGELRTDLEIGCLLRFADAADSIARQLPAILEIISASIGRIGFVLDRAFPEPPTPPPDPPEPPVPDTIMDTMPSLPNPLYLQLCGAGLTTIELVHQAGVRGLRYQCTGMGAGKIFRLLDLMEDAGFPMPVHNRDKHLIRRLKGVMRAQLKRGKAKPGRWESR